MPDICVVGSANLDLIFDVARIPAPGETVLATGQTRGAGGKGLNQAVAAARAGASVEFVGAVGSDDAGAQLRSVLVAAGVGVAQLNSVADVPSGAAVVIRAADGENSIVVSAGANGQVTSLTSAVLDVIDSSPVLLCQQEVPASAVAAAIAAAHAAGAMVIINAAPATRLAPDVLALINCLVVNEHELVAQLADASPTACDPAAVAALARTLVTARRSVVVTLGSDGAVCVDAVAATHVPSPRPDRVVDTTGAGDAFCGALAAALARGESLVRATQYGCAAGSLAVQGYGAAPAMASAAEIAAVVVAAESPRVLASD